MNPDGRLTWNHDDAEGGVTAAAIEQEAEQIPFSDFLGQLSIATNEATIAQKEADQQRARAEKAERERNESIDRVERYAKRLKDCDATAKERQALIEALRAEQPRPLTADDITAAQKDRARDAVLAILAEQEPRPLFATVKAGKIARAAITAALTEPTRPEGAEELETVIGLNAGDWTEGPESVRALADLLASHGVRVTGANT